LLVLLTSFHLPILLSKYELELYSIYFEKIFLISQNKTTLRLLIFNILIFNIFLLYQIMMIFIFSVKLDDNLKIMLEKNTLNLYSLFASFYHYIIVLVYPLLLCRINVKYKIFLKLWKFYIKMLLLVISLNYLSQIYKFLINLEWYACFHIRCSQYYYINHAFHTSFSYKKMTRTQKRYWILFNYGFVKIRACIIPWENRICVRIKACLRRENSLNSRSINIW